MNKTDRKNKTNLVVTWPEHGKLFSFEELLDLNSDFVTITLRVRLDKAIKKDKTVALVGYKNVGKGRPIMILSMNPVTQQFIDAAYANGIQPPEIKPIVSEINATTPISTTEVPSPQDIPINTPVTTIPSAAVSV